MRTERSSSRRLLVFVLLAGGHVGVILLLARSPIVEPLRESIEDFSMTMILFPLTNPRAAARVSAPVPVARHAGNRRLAASQPIATPDTSTAPVVPPEDSGKSIDWNLEMQHAAASVLQAPKTRKFGMPRRSEVEAPRRDQPAHYAGESYRDVFGDSIVWTSASCYVISPAPELGEPTVFARARLTRVGCIRQETSEEDRFKDLPAYKKLHPE
jgi:hypothetical protein